MSAKISQADLLVQLALAQGIALCHTSDAEVFARIHVAGHAEIWAVKSKGFRRWLAQRFYEQYQKAPNSQAMLAALQTIEAMGYYHAGEADVFLRVGRADGIIYVDLGDPAWRAVEVSSAGWRIVPESPVWFRRAPGMEALPDPLLDGRIGDLKRFVNLEHDDDFLLLTAYLLNALHPAGPYPVLVFAGEQGSAKSVTTTLVRRLLDPNSTPLRSQPRDGRDLMISALNGWVMALDNVSEIPDWLSDALCRIATGGGFSTRQLYTDADEVLFSATRPIIINGIEDPVERDDLRDRGLFLTLPPIADGRRRTEDELWAEFEEAAPLLFGALLTAVAKSLADYSGVAIPELPRMADFARRVVAAERELGCSSGRFLTAYNENRQAATEFAIENNRLATEIVSFVDDRNWEGTATDLLAILNGRVPEEIQRRKYWPKTPAKLSGALRRAAPGMRRVGVTVTFWREPGGTDGERRRMIGISRTGTGVPTVPAVPRIPALATVRDDRDGIDHSLTPAHADLPF